MHHARRLVMTSLLGCALAACGGSSSSTPGPAAPTLVFTVQPLQAAAGAPFTVSVTVTGAGGAPVPDGTVTLALRGGPADARLAGPTTRTTTAAGVASFTGLSVARAGSGYALTASSGGGRADSATFSVTPSAPSASASSLTGPAGVVDADGITTGLVTATVRDAHANPVPGAAVGFSAPGARLSAASAVSDGTGQAWVTVCTSTAGSVTITASIGGGTRTVDVTFAEPHTRWVMGYYPGYQRDLYPPEQVDFSALTHLAVGALLPNADGTVDDQFYLDPTNGPTMARTLASRAHAAGRSAILMVGGAGTDAGFRSAASSARRATFVAALEAQRTDLGFDGYDLDWEPLYDTDVPDLLALAAALRAAAPGITLTIPVGWVNANLGLDAWLSQLHPAFDQINIMSYGMADNWGGWVSWHQAALAGEGGDHPSSVSSSALAYASAPVSIPRSRIGIGIGFYGSCWTGTTAPLQALGAGAGVVASDNDMSYANIMADYHAAAAYHWDAAASAGYLSFSTPTGPAGRPACTFISYEDDASIQAKGAWVRANGFGGAIVWTVNQGALAPSGPNPLLTSMKTAFLE